VPAIEFSIETDRQYQHRRDLRSRGEVTTHEPFLVAAGIATGNTLEAVAAAWAVRRFVGTGNAVNWLRYAIGLVVLGALASTIISATIGVASLCTGGLQPWAAFKSWGTVHGLGPYAAGTGDERLMLLQVFMGVVAGSGLILGATISERDASKARKAGREMADLMIPEHLRDRHRRGLARYANYGASRFIGRRFETVPCAPMGPNSPLSSRSRASPLRARRSSPAFCAMSRNKGS
jgi:MASE1 protein